jgi:hypothetical protein
VGVVGFCVGVGVGVGVWFGRIVEVWLFLLSVLGSSSLVLRVGVVW